MDQIFNEHWIEFVVYDEVERFPNWNDKNFDYPFKNRKNIVATFSPKTIYPVEPEKVD